MMLCSAPTLLLLLSTIVSSVSAIECGNALTEPCLGETDKRYDPNSSNNLIDQSVIWSKLSGYYTSEQYGFRGDQAEKMLVDPVTGLFR